MTLSEVRRRWKSWLYRPTSATHPRLKLEELERLEMPSVTLSILGDLNTQPIGSNPTQFAQASNRVFFVASSAAEGTELFETDGTTSGTTLVKDINPGRGGSDIQNLTAVGSKVYFSANDGTHGSELWVSDGTSAGTVMVADLAAGSVSGITLATPIVAVGGRVYFTGTDGTNDLRLWTSDGTPAGTRALTSANLFGPANLTVSGGAVYFTASESFFPNSGHRLYRTDGTLAGTTQVADLGSNAPTGLTDVNGTLFFFTNLSNSPSGRTLTLYKSDGTAAGTTPVEVFTSSDSVSLDSANPPHVVIGGLLYFVANDGTSGRELWKSDGTAAGTTQVEDINPGADSAFPNGFTNLSYRGLLNVGGTLYFVADDGTHGPELWKSGGTAGGTTLVKDLTPGSNPFNSGPNALGVLGDTVYFTDFSAVRGGLYRTDGTAAGTTLVKAYDLSTFPLVQGAGAGGQIPAVNGQLVFASGPSFDNAEPWASDGTGAGTRQLAVLGNGRTVGSSPGDFVQFGGSEYFVAAGGSGTAIWRTDGTPAGTVEAIPLHGFSSIAVKLAVVNGVMYYVDSSSSGPNGNTLYRTDGTTAGSTVIKDFPGGRTVSASVSAPVAVGTATYFTVNTASGSFPDVTYAADLYKTDGTAAGTTLVKSYSVTTADQTSISINPLGTVPGADFFAVTTTTSTPASTTTVDLYKTDGTEAGTALVRSGFRSIRPYSTTGSGGVALGGELYFSADDGTHGSELWQTDGTAAGTGMVLDLASGSSNGVTRVPIEFAGAIYFGGYNGTDSGLFKSDGTAAGTVLVLPSAGYDSETPEVVGGTLYFTTTTVNGGTPITITEDLYTSDGTPAGTVKIATLTSSGTTFSNIASHFTDGGSTTYFFFDDGIHGSELWQTDGTQAGTGMIADLNPGMDSGVSRSNGESSPISIINGRLVFAGFDPTLGAEPFVYGDIPNNTTPTITPVADQVTTPGTVKSVAFTVGDDETPAAGLRVTATSSDTSLVPEGGLAVTGTGADRTLTVTPTAGRAGTVTLTVTVTDGVGATTTDSFVLTIENRPTITDITDQTTATGKAVTASFTVGDAETPAGSLTVTATSSNPALVPNSGLVFGGSGANRTLTITPAAGPTGTTTITITVTDAGGLTATRSVTVTVAAPTVTVSPELLPAAHAGVAYSRALTASGSIGPYSFALAGAPSWLAISPTGVLSGTPPADAISLYTFAVTVTDDYGYTTSIPGGLAVRPIPTISVSPAMLPIGQVGVPYSAAYTATGGTAPYTFTADMPFGLVLHPNGTATGTPTGSGSASVIVHVTDADGYGTDFNADVQVNPAAPLANTPPTVTAIGDQTAAEGAAKAVSFTVGDAQTAAGDLAVTVTSSNPMLLPAGALALGGSGADRTLTLTPAAGQSVTATVTVTVTDAGGLTAARSFTLTVTPAAQPSRPGPELVGVPQFAVGSDAGGTVRFFNADGSERLGVTPFPGSTGGVRVATADFNGDGVPDLVVGTGPGAPTHVRALDGKTGAELFAVDPFEAAFTGGVYVAAGDVTGDGVPDLVITPDEGGGPRVRVFSGAGFTLVADFLGIDDPNFRGGARAAVGDVSGDGTGDLIVAAGFGGGPRVAVFDGASLASGPAKLFGDFFLFEPSLRNGVFVAAGDLDGDGFADVIAGGGPGGGPRVFALSGKSLLAGNQTQLANFFAGDAGNRSGVRVAVKNLDGDARADLVVGAGTGGGSRVTAYLGKDVPADGPAAEEFAFDAVPGFTGGVFVG